jgi:branched-chain amino acid transport system permease protein
MNRGMNRGMSQRRELTSYWSILLVTAGFALLPLGLTSNAMLNFLAFAMIITLAAQGWNVIGGFGGQFSFGHAAFFGTGAYAMALLQVRFAVNPWLALPLASVLGGCAGWIIGYLAFRARLRGSYFALVTLAFAEVLRIVAHAWGFTGAAAGVLVPLRLDPAQMQFSDRRVFYWFALLLVTIVLVASRFITRSRFGAQLVALRENEDAARALGVNTLVVKLTALIISAAITATAGALYTQKFLYLDASLAYGSWISVDALLAPIIGGLGTVFGPLVGTIVLLGLGEITKILFSQLTGGALPGIDLVAFGGLLILCVAFAPRGVIGLVARRALKAPRATP